MWTNNLRNNLFSLQLKQHSRIVIKKERPLHIITLLAVIPVLCTGRPYFLFTLNQLFQSLCLALLSHATAVPVSMCVTHHLPFYWFWNLLHFLSHFPTRRTIGLKAKTQIDFGRSFELDISEHKASFLAISPRIFPLRKLLFFYFSSYLAEIAYLSTKLF